VLVPLFTTVLVMDFNSAFMASTSFRRLLLVTSEDTDRFTIICVFFFFFFLKPLCATP
jgi:hypothetical protein